MALKKSIGLWSATLIVIGSVIASGIFMKPATMAGQLGSPILLLMVWLLSGIVSLFGGMSMAELGAMFPETGGQYVYLQKTYNEFTAFLYGWSTIAVINTAAIAGIAFVCADYIGFFVHIPHFSATVEQAVKWHIPFIADIYPLQNFGTKMLTIVIIALLTVVNYISTRAGNAIQFVATFVKVLAFILLVAGIFLSGKGSTKNLVTPSPDFHLSGLALILGFVAATTGALSAYDGWININMVAGEVKDPQRNLPKSLIAGLFACIIIYILVNCAYLYALPIEAMASSPLVASDAATNTLGRIGGGLIAALIVVSAFGSAGVNLLTNARVVFAMGEDGTFFSWSGKVHERFQTPGNSIVLMSVWSCLFVISGSFDILFDMFVFMTWVFYGLTVTGIFILRKKMPEAHRPYRVSGYPFVPIVFLVFTLLYIGLTLYNDIQNYNSGKSPIINSVFGILLTLAGAPLYWYFRRRKRIGRN